MNQHLVRLSTRSMSRSDWLAQRRKSIGGSDAAGIIGLSQYATPYTVWADKTGRLPDQEDNEAMRQGRDLEEYVAERWMEATGKTVRRSNAILYNSLYPFAHADIDRTVVGENAGLECKTTSTLNLRQFKGVEFPEKYYAQCPLSGGNRCYTLVSRCTGLWTWFFHLYSGARSGGDRRTHGRRAGFLEAGGAG